MKKQFSLLTAGELAKLHQLNKRTLHYYDEVGLFCPKIKGENGYRYYTLDQTMELENILSLREMDMSIEEIIRYNEKPNTCDFENIADSKIQDIEEKIKKLNSIKANFLHKKELLLRCNQITHGKIELVELPKRYFLLSEVPLSFQNNEDLVYNSNPILEHLKEAWALSNYRRNCGSFISLEKVYQKDFTHYNGLFSVIDKKEKAVLQPKGLYIRGYCVGDWDGVPSIYEKMLEFSNENNLKVSGYAFESGLNEFAIKSEDEYITQIEIFCESESLKSISTKSKYLK